MKRYIIRNTLTLYKIFHKMNDMYCTNFTFVCYNDDQLVKLQETLKSHCIFGGSRNEKGIFSKHRKSYDKFYSKIL